MGAVYGEFAGLEDTLFLHVAIVTDTIIKLSLNLAEEMDLSEAIILASALSIPPRCPPRGRLRGAEPSRGDGAPHRRVCRGCIPLTGTSPGRGAGQAAGAPDSPGRTVLGAAGAGTAPLGWQHRWARLRRTKAPLRVCFQPVPWLPPAAPAFPILLPL